MNTQLKHSLIAILMFVIAILFTVTFSACRVTKVTPSIDFYVDEEYKDSLDNSKINIPESAYHYDTSYVEQLSLGAVRIKATKYYDQERGIVVIRVGGKICCRLYDMSGKYLGEKTFNTSNM